jgi:hypothetical protein
VKLGTWDAFNLELISHPFGHVLLLHEDESALLGREKCLEQPQLRALIARACMHEPLRDAPDRTPNAPNGYVSKGRA